MRGTFHEPVLVAEVLNYLSLGAGKVVVDATIGGGRHAEALLANVGPQGQVIGIDRDMEALAEARARLGRHGRRVILRQACFSQLGQTLDELGYPQVDGILLDLGLSSHQLDTPARGFSFQLDGPLDMRMDQNSGESAASLLMRLAERELARMIRDYGEERFASAIARRIVAFRESGRPVRTTGELRRVVEQAIPRKHWPRNIHPATRTFQALRIAVNKELEELEAVLPQIPPRLKPRGRVCVISYHSLEDRRVKAFFQAAAKGCICPPDLPGCQCGGRPSLRVLTKRPVRPGEAEMAGNPRSRSARLRAAEKLEETP